MGCGPNFTLDDLAALEKAIYDAVESVKYSDREVKYRSLEEMKELARDMRAQLCPSSASGGGRFKKLFAKSSKGLC